MKKYQVAAITPQGTFYGALFGEEYLEENTAFLKKIEDFSSIRLEDDNGKIAFFSKQMIGRTVFVIQPIEEN